MDMKNDKAEQLKKQYFKIAFCIILLVICSIFATVFVRKAFTWDEVKQQSSYTYQTVKNANYQVKLIGNTFIQKNPQGPDELYIARLIQSIPATFTYQFNAPTRANISYNYRVDARIVANYKSTNDESGEGNEVWNKQYPLVPMTSKSVTNGNNFSISQPVTIDFNTYQQEVTAFIRQLALSIDAELQVNMAVQINGVSETGEKFDKTDNVSVVIPLSEDVFKIVRDKNVVIDAKKSVESEFVTKINYEILIVGILFFAVAMVCVVVLAAELLKRSHSNKYKSEVRKILNDYGEIIVEVTTPFDKTNKDIIHLKNFNEMIDLEQELRIPILCYQDEIFGYTSFAIIQEKTIYIFELKRTDVDPIMPINTGK